MMTPVAAVGPLAVVPVAAVAVAAVAVRRVRPIGGRTVAVIAVWIFLARG